MRNRRPSWALILLPVIVGLTGLSTLMQRPSFALIRTVDVVQLLGSGVCFGVAMAALGFWFRNRRGENSGNQAQ